MASLPVNENRFIPAFTFSSAVYAIISPYLSLMVRNLGYSTALIGILLGIFEGAGIAGPLVFGYLADRKGKYRLLLIVTCIIPAVIAFPIAYLIHPLASALLLALLAFGFKSNVSLLDAVTTIQIGPTGNYGKIRVWGSIGFVITTLYLQWTPVFQPVSAVNIAFWIMLISAALIVPVLILPLSSRGISVIEKPVKNNKAGKIDKSSRESRPGGKKILTVYFIAGFILIFFSRLSMAAFYTYFPLYLTEAIQWNAIGFMFALATSTEIPCIFFSKLLIRRFGSLPLLALSALAVCIRLMLWALFPIKPIIVAAQLLHSLCFGFYYPAAIDFISRVFPPEKRGVGMSVFLALGSGLSALIGNMAGGVIVDAAGYRSLFAIYAAVSGAAVLVYGVLRLLAPGTSVIIKTIEE